MGLPTHKLSLWMVAYNLHLWEVAKALCFNFGFTLTFSNNEGAWVVIYTFRLSVHVRGTSFISFSDCSKFQSLVVCLLACLGA